MTPAEEAASARNGGIVLELSDRAKFVLRGADRVRYLNGQVSQAVTTLGLDEARAGCVLTAKGKLNACLHFFATEEALHLDAPASQREELSARLERYIIADDVEMLDVTEEHCLFHVFGAAVGDVTAPGGIVRESRRFQHPGADVLVPRAAAEVVRKALLARWPLASAETAEQLRIEGGVPAWGTELDENTLPVEAGLARSAIDYHKGCYIGQEVISRLKSVGHVNRTLRGLVAEEGAELVAGMPLTTPEDAAAGSVTSAIYSFALARSIGLGYVKRGVTSETLLARLPDPGAEAPAVQVEVRDLPLIT